VRPVRVPSARYNKATPFRPGNLGWLCLNNTIADAAVNGFVRTNNSFSESSQGSRSSAFVVAQDKGAT